MHRKKDMKGVYRNYLFPFFKKSSIFSRNKSIFLSKWRIVLIHGKRDIMAKPIKTKLIIVIIGALLYILLNFLPFSRWIENEYGYLALRFTVLLLMSIALILLKKKNHIELEIPHHQISYLWLIPLAVPCFSNFLYVLFMDISPLGTINAGMLTLDLFTDFFLSIVEDLLFVDILNSLFLDLFNGKIRKAKLLSMMLCATIFTVIHSYNFLYDTPSVAAFELMFIFLVTLECSYLAIYFDKEWIPIAFHFLFNAIDFITFEAIFDVTMSLKYFGFSILVASFALFYILALIKISSLQKYRTEPISFN